MQSLRWPLLVDHADYLVMAFICLNAVRQSAPVSSCTNPQQRRTASR